MKYYKRIVSALLGCALFFSLNGCGEKTEIQSQEQEATSTTEHSNEVLTTDYLASDTFYTATEYGALTDLWGTFCTNGILYALSEENEIFSLIQVDGDDCYELYQAPEGGYLLWLTGNENTLAFVQSTMHENSEQLVLYTVDNDGTNLKEVSIDSTLLESIGGMSMDSSGNIYLLSSDGIQVVDGNGQNLSVFTPAGQPSDLLKGNDGCVYVASHQEGCTYVEQVNIASEKAEATYTFSGDQWQVLSGFGSWNFLLNTETQLLGYDGNSLVEIVNWSTNSIRPSALAAVWENTAGVLCYFDQNQLYQLTQVAATDVPETSQLILGVWDGTNLEPIIQSYQKLHPEVTINIRQYALADGMTELNLELAAGDGPDMLDLAWVDYAAYISKGILADLGPFLSSDGLDLDDFIGTEVLKANNSLYVLPTCFTIDTWKGLTKVFGDKTGWTWENYQTTQSELAEGQYMTALTAEDFLLSNLSELIQECVDFSSATCDFSPLQEILTAAAGCDFSGEFYSSDLDDGTVKMEGAYISSIEEFNNIVKDEHYTLIGMPSEDGRCTASYTFSCLLGINATSNNTSGAWELIHYAVCEYPYEDMVSLYGISNYRPVVETEISQLLDPSSKYGDAEITGSEDEGYTIDGVFYEPGIISMTPVISQDVVTKFWSYLDDISLYYAYDSDIAKIVQEESAAYFSGDKSATDVIDVIENRVSIFLGEQQ